MEIFNNWLSLIIFYPLGFCFLLIKNTGELFINNDNQKKLKCIIS